MMEGPCADSEEKREPAGDIDTVVVDGLKVLDPKRPIREADIAPQLDMSASDPTAPSGASNWHVVQAGGTAAGWPLRSPAHRYCLR